MFVFSIYIGRLVVAHDDDDKNTSYGYRLFPSKLIKYRLEVFDSLLDYK
jgi:hypothetical protein